MEYFLTTFENQKIFMKLLLIIQGFFNQLSQSIASIIKVILLSKSTKKPPKATHNEMVILGNGPSLKDFLTYNRKFLQDKSSLAVNHFAGTDAFTEIKPNFYLINVPEFWTDNVDDDVRQRRDNLVKNLIEKTTWKMTFLLGIGAKKSAEWQSISDKNEFITIYYLNPTPVAGFAWFKHFCYQKQWGMPRPHNVLIPSLMMSINMQFDKIYITGADHNWMKELFVADDNTVYLTQKHFYDLQTAQPDVMKKTGKGKRKMHEILIKFVHSFAGYFDINDYAKKRGVKIINITPNSFIDAFERMKLD